jgi:hypothetical protein
MPNKTMLLLMHFNPNLLIAWEHLTCFQYLEISMHLGTPFMPYNKLYILCNVVGSHNAIGVGAHYGSKINKKKKIIKKK